MTESRKPAKKHRMSHKKPAVSLHNHGFRFHRLSAKTFQTTPKQLSYHFVTTKIFLLKNKTFYFGPPQPTSMCFILFHIQPSNCNGLSERKGDISFSFKHFPCLLSCTSETQRTFSLPLD